MWVTSPRFSGGCAARQDRQPEDAVGLALPPHWVGGCDHERVPCSVLVVDDDSAFRDLAARILTGWGLVVVGEAGTVASAVDFAVELHPDVALVDVGLPDGDGFALTERLVSLPRSVRVILISSDADSVSVRAAERAGAQGFVGKDDLSGQELRRLLENG
jgi:CheY-like chemotaxis protein